MVDPVNHGLPAVRDVCDPVPHDVESFGVDEDGPLPLHGSDSVEVPATPVHFNSEQLDELQRVIRDHNGEPDLHIYLEARAMAYAMLGIESYA